MGETQEMIRADEAKRRAAVYREFVERYRSQLASLPSGHRERPGLSATLDEVLDDLCVAESIVALHARVAELTAERDEAHAELAALTAAAGQSVVVLCPIRPGGPFAALRSRRGAGGPAFELPGGKIEPGEGTFDAARREVHEELGAPLAHQRPLVPLGEFLHVYGGRLWNAHAFLGDLGGAHLAERTAAGEPTWATREELLAGWFGPVVAKILAAYDAHVARRA